MNKAIVLKYEYDCGGYTHDAVIDIDSETFENDTLLVLVCSYLSTWCGYPGKDIDEYLHNKFPKEHTLEFMCGYSIYNVYDCEVEGLKDFNTLADGLLHMNCTEAEKYIKFECHKFNEQLKKQPRENFKIWDE